MNLQQNCQSLIVLKYGNLQTLFRFEFPHVSKCFSPNAYSSCSVPDLDRQLFDVKTFKVNEWIEKGTGINFIGNIPSRSK